jgi:hypothetical protein
MMELPASMGRRHGLVAGSLGRFRSGPKDVAERLTGGLLHLQREEAELSDRDTVQRWLREMRPEHDTQVFVHRPWGTVVAVADRGESVGAFLSDGKKGPPSPPKTLCTSASASRGYAGQVPPATA